MNKQTIVIAVIALIVGGGIGYFAHPASAATSGRGNFSGAAGTFAGRTGTAGATGGGFLTGTVASTASGSITLNTRDGSSHVVLVTPSTTVSKSVNGTLADVTVGSTVIVSGSTNSDGSVSATLIQLRPAGSMGTQTSTTPSTQPSSGQ